MLAVGEVSFQFKTKVDFAIQLRGKYVSEALRVIVHQSILHFVDHCCNLGRNLVFDNMYYTVGLSIQTNSLVLCLIYKLSLSYSNTLEICRCGHKYTDFTEFQ